MITSTMSQATDDDSADDHILNDDPSDTKKKKQRISSPYKREAPHHPFFINMLIHYHVRIRNTAFLKVGIQKVKHWSHGKMIRETQ